MTAVPRLWISSEGKVLDCDELDLSHGMMVARDPQRFGLPAGHFDAHLAAIDAGLDVVFDFDAAIALAQANGWARTSRDASSGIAISARDRKTAQKAAHLVLDRGSEISALDVEIGWIESGRIISFHYRLDCVQTGMFLRFGRLPKGQRHELPIEGFVEPSVDAAPRVGL